MIYVSINHEPGVKIDFMNCGHTKITQIHDTPSNLIIEYFSNRK